MHERPLSERLEAALAGVLSGIVVFGAIFFLGFMVFATLMG